MKMEELENIHDHGHLNPFYISFSDLMVLLCVFFVLILGMSKIEIGSFEKMKTGFTGETKGTLVELHSKLVSIAKPESGVKVELARDGVRIDLDTTILFDTGSSVLRKENLSNLEPILTEIFKTYYRMDIEGHTDDVPLYKLHGEERESNWSLSGRRAASMVHYLQELGFPDSRMRIVGYGSTHPKVITEGSIGPVLERARAQNRRVSLLIR
jgi:chemotaxis protein MotB